MTTFLNITRRTVQMNTQGRGLTGDKGDNSYIHIKWHTEGSQTLLDVADDYIGIYVDHTPADSEVYADYTWFKYKGDPGNLTGPASSVNENIPIFDGVTGDKLKDSGVKLSDKANVDYVADALALKADIVSLETEKKLLMDEIDSLKKTAIENSNSPYLTVSGYGDVTLAKNSVGVGTVGVDGVTVEDLITNGDFSGLSPWVVPSSWEYVSASDNILTIKVKVLVSQSDGMLYQNTAQSPIVGHKYFITLDTYAPFTNAVRIIYGGYDNSTNIIPTANAWKTSAFIFTAVSTAKTISFLCGTLTNYSINDEFKFRNIKLIDLTAHGLDSLTVSQVDALVAAGYFDGEKTFSGVGCIKAVGKNINCSSWELGSFHGTTLDPVDDTTVKRSMSYIPILPGTAYIVSLNKSALTHVIIEYDDFKNPINRTVSSSITTLNNTRYIRLARTNTDLSEEIQIEQGSIVTPYTPYMESRQYFNTGPMYSNVTAKDTLTYRDGKYYHTHNVDSDGVAIAEPYDTEVETNGQFLALSEGTVTYEPWYPDIAVYTDKFTLTKAITAVKELYKYGSETLITDAVIAVDGLSFTSASLTAGDLAYGVFEFDEPLRPLMTIKSRNDVATCVDTVTGTVYTFAPVVTNGVIASWELTEV